MQDASKTVHNLFMAVTAGYNFSLITWTDFDWRTRWYKRHQQRFYWDLHVAEHINIVSENTFEENKKNLYNNLEKKKL